MAEPQEQTLDQPLKTPVREPRKRYISERGPFEIRANPTLNQPRKRGTVDRARVHENYEHSPLAEKYGKAGEEKMIEMAHATAGGITSTRLFDQDAPNGMRLSHVWMGANYQLSRHSHPKFGDCLYCVVAGEIYLGSRRLGAGSVIFLPEGMPYKFKAGPAGAEVLEYRSDGEGDKNAPLVKLAEDSIESIQQIIDAGKAHQHEWEAPEQCGETAIRQAELDGRTK